MNKCGYVSVTKSLQKPVADSVLLDKKLASFPGGGAELEESLASVSFQTREESAVPIVAHREELRTPLGSCLLGHPWVTHRRLTDDFHCYSEQNSLT